MSGLSNKKYKMPRLPDEELRVIARDLVTGRLWMPLTAKEFEQAFGFLLMVAMQSPRAWMTTKYVRQIGTAVGRLDQAMPLGINGTPMFTSGRFIHKQDLRPLWRWIEHFNQALE